MRREALLGLGAGVSVVAYAVPYLWFPGTWWRTLPSTALILAIGILIYRRDAMVLFGLSMSRRSLALSVGLLLILLPMAHAILFSSVAAEPLTLLRNSGPRSWTHQLFQVFNDEIVLRAALLTLLLRLFPYPKTVVLATALMFSVAHHFMYRLGGLNVDLPAMLTLFSFGALSNVLFVWCGHIGYGFAIHYAWNFWRFSGTRYYLDGVLLPEGATFNFVEGSPLVAGVAVTSFAVTFALFCARPPPQGGSDAADRGSHRAH